MGDLLDETVATESKRSRDEGDHGPDFVSEQRTLLAKDEDETAKMLEMNVREEAEPEMKELKREEEVTEEKEEREEKEGNHAPDFVSEQRTLLAKDEEETAKMLEINAKEEAEEEMKELKRED